MGNLTSRLGTDPDLLAYGYGDRAASGQVPALTGGSQAVTYVDVGGTTDDWRYDYDPRGNLDSKYVGTASATPANEYTFDIENRLTAVKANGQTTTFSYDANGQRVMTKRPDETILYTPFPDYEREVPESGPVIERVTYRLAGQIVAVRAAAFNYVYSDHLGNVVGFGGLGGGFTTASLARYDPFGNFRTTPTTNPGTTARRFTGHMHNNTGTTSLGLIYMNARYYLPEVGRFASADSIVPEPGEPQSYNRYSYSYNNPINYTDPSGHMATSGCDGVFEGCLSDPETWGANFITYLIQHGTASNPVGKFIINFFWSTVETLSAEEQGDIGVIEEVSQGAIDAGVSYVTHATQRLGVDPARAWQLQSELGDAFLASIFLILDTYETDLTPGQAGRYGDLRARGRVGDDLVPHHIPQKALGYTSESDGGAIVMWSREHVQTRTYGWRGALTVQQDAGKPFRQILAIDILDVRGIVGSRYNRGLLDLIKYYRDNFPWLMTK